MITVENHTSGYLLLEPEKDKSKDIKIVLRASNSSLPASCQISVCKCEIQHGRVKTKLKNTTSKYLHNWIIPAVSGERRKKNNTAFEIKQIGVKHVTKDGQMRFFFSFLRRNICSDYMDKNNLYTAIKSNGMSAHQTLLYYGKCCQKRGGSVRLYDWTRSEEGPCCYDDDDALTVF